METAKKKYHEETTDEMIKTKDQIERKINKQLEKLQSHYKALQYIK